MSFREAYARKFSLDFRLQPGTYQSDDFNGRLYQMPFGEMYVDKENFHVSKLYRLGQDVSLNEHIQEHFFDQVKSEDGHLMNMVYPFFIMLDTLKGLPYWPDWQMLEGYLRGQGLYPTLLFKNKHYKVLVEDDAAEMHVIADIRVGFEDGFTYTVSP
ncbi:hypothetical protein [Tardiphaga sp.]|uniref:hypothetical protein n=1 Tax=Tardiphaga sp. TaxID=1926292 RepID=UPI0037DA1A0E